MLAAKLPQPPPSAALTLRSSLLTLAIITLVSFTFLSLKSLHSPSLQYSPSTSPTPLTVHPSLPKAVDDGDVDNVEKVAASENYGYDDVYHFPEVFRLNYERMRSRFKVYVYSDGDPNTYYQPSEADRKIRERGLLLSESQGE